MTEGTWGTSHEFWACEYQQVPKRGDKSYSWFKAWLPGDYTGSRE